MESSIPKWLMEGKCLCFCENRASVDNFANRPESLPAFEELFLYACPKFITANPPPYDDPIAINTLISGNAETESPNQTSPAQTDAMHRHLVLFLADIEAQLPVPTLRSFLKLYTSLGAKKLANFLDADEEELVQEMMVLKQASRSISRVAGSESTSLLDGQTITTSDLNFVIDEVRFDFYIFFERIILTFGVQ